MHLVYKITFPARQSRNERPYQYIGSKSNSTFDGTNIVDNAGKKYTGSSNDPHFHKLISENEPMVVQILAESNEYPIALAREKELHELHDVVANPSFFNRSIACVNTFSDPNYVTAKHSITGKIARLPKTHPAYISREWVGVTHGDSVSDETKKKLSIYNTGSGNPFYGKVHNTTTRHRISEARQSWLNTVEGKEARAQSKIRTSKLMQGVPKSPEHRAKIGRKGFKQVKNVLTGETRRVRVDDILSEEWKNPSSLKPRFATCTVCGVTTNCGNITRWHNTNCKGLKCASNKLAV